MYNPNVMMLNGTLHYSTWNQRGLDIGFSSCAVPNYLILCPSILDVFGDSEDLEVLGRGPGVWSKSGTGASSRREGSIEVKYEARSLE